MHSVAGDYLEAIYTLQAEGEHAYGVTLAELFGVSRANASATLGRLARDGLVQVDGRQVALTPAGREGAEAGLRRHRLTERFLVDVLGLDWATVHAQARSFERGLTPLLEERIDARLDHPRTCPHGSPIPRPDLDAAAYLRIRAALRLSQAPPGVALRLLMLSELIEDDVARLRFCAERGLLPGAALLVVSRAADGALLARGDGEPYLVEAPLAGRIWVVEELQEEGGG